MRLRRRTDPFQLLSYLARNGREIEEGEKGFNFMTLIRGHRERERERERERGGVTESECHSIR